MTGILRTIILVGALQGVIVGSLLYSLPYRKSNRILAIMLWLISLAGFNLYLDYTGWFYSSSSIAIIHALVPGVIFMPIGPLVYFYIRASLDPGFRIESKQKIHFLPVIIDLIPQLTAAIFLILASAGFIKPNARPWGTFIDNYNVYADIPRWFSLTVYLWFSRQFIHHRKLMDAVAIPPVPDAMIKWLYLFIAVFISFQVIWLAYLIPYVIPDYTDWVLSTFDWYPVYIPLAVLIYWLGIKGYIVAMSVRAAAVKKPQVLKADIVQIINSIHHSMKEDKLYLDQLLTINRLSKHTGVSPKTLSAVLNQYIGKGFNEYVNSYRVEEVKKRLLQPGLDHLTITGIASECGFNSEASFQRIFKQQTGLSPSAFRRSAKKAP